MDNGFHLLPSANSANECLAALRCLQQDGTLCDVVLETDRKEQILAHRVLLAASSPFFKAMFASGLSESTQRSVRLPEIDHDVLNAIVSYVYGGEVTLELDAVLPLLAAADRLQIGSLFDKCCQFLERSLRPDNCLALRSVAEMHGCRKLADLCLRYACDNFDEVVKSDDYLSLPCSELVELISSDDIRIPTEETVYLAVVRWLYHDLHSRRLRVVEVMSYVRFPFVSFTFLTQVESEEMIRSERDCQSYIQEARVYKSSPEKRAHLRCSPRARPRKPSGLESVILVAGGMSKERSLALVEQYNRCTDEWTSLTEMMTERCGHTACHLNGNLYVVGGYNEKEGYLNSMDCYSLRDKKWHSVAPLHIARRYHGAEVLYGLLYVIGGRSHTTVLNNVERYDPESNMWTNIPSMHTPRMYHGSAVVNGLLLVAGGHDGFNRLSSAELFNPSSEQWTAITSMLSKRSVMGIATIQNLVYVAGGYNGEHHLHTVEYYNVELDQWYPGPTMCCSRSALGLVAYNGCLYACGGLNGTITKSVECLSPGSSRWQPATNMNTARVHFGVAST